jgi:GNAT superfamily N-acetyltransferase
MPHTLRNALLTEVDEIWRILVAAIQRRKEDGSTQWQFGYPNPAVVQMDIEKGVGYVVVDDRDQITAYLAILKNDEPAYERINGKWLSTGDFLVIHRLAVSEEHLGQGLGKKALELTQALALSQGIRSVKIDTNFDNGPMLAIVEKLGYIYCGEVVLDGGSRKAFEKLLPG